MSSHIIPADELYQVISSDQVSENIKLEHIQKLKSHIKKGFIDLSSAPKYFNSLINAIDSPTIELRSNSLSTLSYLIKRISVQDKSESLLKQQSSIVVPILVSKLVDPVINISQLARNALENYWIAANVAVEELVLKHGFVNLNSKLCLEVVNWLIHVSGLNPNFQIGRFVHVLVKVLSVNHGETSQHARVLFEKYYSKSYNNIRDLIPELQAQRVSLTFQGERLPIDIASDKPTKERSRTPEIVRIAPVDVNNSSKDSDLSSLLNMLLEKVNYELDQTIAPENILDSSMLIREFTSYQPCFQGKETESNWKTREKNIIHMRSILRGNSPEDFKSELLICLRDMSSGISKAISSLRTTLSMHACQLLKECAIILQSDFDSIGEILLPTLIKLCSSTKTITSTNANMCIASLYANTSYSPKIIQRIISTAEERNYQPRSYTAIWLQIVLLRFGGDSTFLENHEMYLVDTVNKLLGKLLRDANPNVRSVAKDCYWTYSKVFPDHGETFLQKVDSNTMKVLQRSRPPTNSERSNKPLRSSSLRESIIEKNKEMKLRRSISGRSTPEIPIQPLPKSLKSNVATRLGMPLVRSSTEPEPTHFKPAILKSAPPPVKEITRQPRSGSLSLPEHKPISNPFTYTTDKDPMVNFLSSEDTTVIAEGINLLKLAVTQEEIPKQARESLKYISVKQPFLLKPLFMANDKIFKASAQLFSSSDFIRLCALIFPEVDEKTVDLIISCIPDLDTFYDTSINLLTNVANTTDIFESQDLIMQLVKHKTEIAKSIMQILSISLGRVPIADIYFSKFLAALFNLVITFKMTDNYKLCCQLIKQLYSIDHVTFLGAVEQLDQSTREEVECIVGIDSTFNLKPLSRSIYDLTEIPFQKSNALEFSPVKMTSDFTLIRPSRDVFLKKTHSPIKEVNEVERESQNGTSVAVSTSSSHHSDNNLVDDFAQVQITEPSRNSSAKSSIEAIIEKMDPLKSISNKSKKIPIYEDNKDTEDKTPQVEGFHVAKVSNVTCWSIEQFESCCQHLKEDFIDSVKIMRLIGILGSLPNCDEEITQYFNNTGKAILVTNLWQYFNNSNLKYSDIVNGLVLLKLSLPYSESIIDMSKLFHILDQACHDETPGSEIHCIWEKILHSITHPEKLQDIMLDYLQSQGLNSNVASICLNYFIVTKLSTEKTLRLIQLVTGFLEGNDIELLRLSVLCYSKLLTSDISPEVKTTLDEVKTKLPLHQQRLIEYYMK